MLKINERISISGESVIHENEETEKVVCVFSALIDVAHPEKMIVNQIQKDKEAYKEHREACRADFAAFEDYAFKRQSEVSKANAE